MKIDKILTSQRAVIIPQGKTKKSLLEEASRRLVQEFPNLEQPELFEKLLAREKLGSTAIGSGVAIPHCRIHHCSEIAGLLILLEEGMDFDAPDDQLVDLIFVLLVPLESTHEHLRTLAMLTDLFNCEEYRTTLRRARDSHSLYKAALCYDSVNDRSEKVAL